MVFLFIVFLVVYFLIAYQSNKANPDAALQKETKALTDRIGSFMELPLDEQPTLATVTDQEKLKGQNFFTHAQNGDKLLVYPKAKKAILYRPSTKKVIEVSNLISSEEQSRAAAGRYSIQMKKSNLSIKKKKSQKRPVRALVLFSGGLDSILAVKILERQGIEVSALVFTSYFFDAKQARKSAMENKIKSKIVDFSDEHLKIIKDPCFGRGAGMNPCIDCHLLMLKAAKSIMRKRKL